MRGVGLMIAFLISLVLWVLLLSGCEPKPYAVKPPERYNGPRAVALLIIDSQAAITDACIAQKLPANTVACANPKTIWMPDPCQFSGAYAELMCHELGHVRGWHKSHPL
jgi:hypothetical protein